MAAATLRLAAPPIDRFEIEAPVAADLEGGQFFFLEQPVNRRRMHPQIACDLFQSKHSRHNAPFGRLSKDERTLTNCQRMSTICEQPAGGPRNKLLTGHGSHFGNYYYKWR